jgi:hypothetical protein
MSKNENEEMGVFLSVEQAFNQALDSLKHSSLNEEDKGKVYVWKQRFKEGNLSHSKVEAIMEKAGFHKVVEERWMLLEPLEPIKKEEVKEAKVKKTRAKKVKVIAPSEVKKKSRSKKSSELEEAFKD